MKLNGGLAVVIGMLSCCAARAQAEPRRDDGMWRVNLEGLMPGGKARQPIVLHVLRDKGVWRTPFATGWNKAAHAVDLGELQLAADTLTGDIGLTINSDGWLPGAGVTIKGKVTVQARIGDGTVSGTYRAMMGREQVEGRISGVFSEAPADLEGHRLRLGLVTAQRGYSVLWFSVRDGKPVDGYLFGGSGDRKVDVSSLKLTATSISGTIPGPGGISLQGGIAFGKMGGTWQPVTKGISGTFQGTVLAFDRSRLAPPPHPPPVWHPPTNSAAAAKRKEPQLSPEAAAFLAKAGLSQKGQSKSVWPRYWGEYPDGLKRVTLPPGHRPDDADTRYPVILHNGVGGYPGNLFTLMKQGLLPPSICCNVSLGGDGNDGKLDMIVDYLHKNWPADKSPRCKVLMGFSAGAHHAFRYIDRTDLIANFALFGHPLKGSGWTHQRAREYEALLRGTKHRKPYRPAILLVVGTREGSWKGMQLTRDWLQREFRLQATYLEIPDLGHKHDQHFAKRGKEIAGWLEAAFGREDKAAHNPRPKP